MPINCADDQLLMDLKIPEHGVELSSEQAFQLAYVQALRGFGRVSPNPPVGAVLVDRSHRFIATGAHLGYGGDHAEVELLKNIPDGSDLNDSTLYVTLEPCSHFGKTPPCAAALTELPLKQVWFGAVDPNKKVAGKGQQILRSAGIGCDLFENGLKNSLRLIDVFSTNQLEHRTFVALKAAITLDGAVTDSETAEVPVTGKRARDYGHFLRRKYDGIAVGAGTLLIDNPELNCRLPEGRDPVVVAFDPHCRSLTRHGLELNILKREKLFWVSFEENAEKIRKIRDDIVPIVIRDSESPKTVLAQLFEEGVYSLLLEGGPGLYGEFVNQKLVDAFHLFQAPKVFCGDKRKFWSENFCLSSEWQAKDLRISPLGDDWVSEFYL